MKMPSVAEIMDIFKEILTIISEGGQKAILLLFMVNFAIAISACYFLIRFLLKFIEKHNDEKEKALAAKDELLNSARLRADATIEQYAKFVAQSIEKDSQHTQELRELRALVTMFLTSAQLGQHKN